MEEVRSPAARRTTQIGHLSCLIRAQGDSSGARQQRPRRLMGQY
uniref:Uncharacterized protein n=1 Tax=Arundo donax TaxID=35708 RepID=A0A0A8YZV8_ARUDO